MLWESGSVAVDNHFAMRWCCGGKRRVCPRNHCAHARKRRGHLPQAQPFPPPSMVIVVARWVRAVRALCERAFVFVGRVWSVGFEKYTCVFFVFWSISPQPLAILFSLSSLNFKKEREREKLGGLSEFHHFPRLHMCKPDFYTCVNKPNRLGGDHGPCLGRCPSSARRSV